MIERRRTMAKSGSAVDWESIARCMLYENVIVNEIVLDASVTKISMYAFSRRKVRSVKTTSLTTIPTGCFYECLYIERIELNEGVTTISQNGIRTDSNTSAVDSCTVVLPSTVTSIANYAIYNSYSVVGTRHKLFKLICKATVPPTCGGTNAVSAARECYVPDEAVEDYKAATGWSTIASVIYPMSDLVGGGVVKHLIISEFVTAERVAA